MFRKWEGWRTFLGLLVVGLWFLPSLYGAEPLHRFQPTPLKSVHWTQNDFKQGLQSLIRVGALKQNLVTSKYQKELKREYQSFTREYQKQYERYSVSGFPVQVHERDHFPYYYEEVSFESFFSTGQGLPSDQVFVEYYLPARYHDCNEAYPVVVLLPFASDRFSNLRKLSEVFGYFGGEVAVAIVHPPHYGRRRNFYVPPEPEEEMNVAFVSGGVEQFKRNYWQTIADLHLAKDWLAARKEVDGERVTLMGISFGGLFTGLAAGVDPGHFTGGYLLTVSGGNVFQTIRKYQDLYPEEQASQVLDSYDLSQEDLAKALASIDPLLYAPRLKGSRLQFLASLGDELMPPRTSVQPLIRSFNKKNRVQTRWWDGKHSPEDESVFFKFKNLFLPMQRFAKIPPSVHKKCARTRPGD